MKTLILFFSAILFSFFVFAQSTTWEEVQRLYPVDASVSGSLFGSTAYTDGQHILVGMPGDDTQARDGGAVYLYRRQLAGENIYWPAVDVLFPKNPIEKSRFGASMAKNGDQFIIGAPGGEGLSGRTGVVYVFWQEGGQWQEGKLTASDGQAGDQFGFAVASSGPYLLVGAPERTADGKDKAGAVYVFTRSQDVRQWEEVAIITAEEAREKERFGYSLALQEGRAVVGASFASCRGIYCDSEGAAYLFEYDPGNDRWVQLNRLTSNRFSRKDNFGRALAFNGEDIMVGASAYGSFWPWLQRRGAVYLFSFEKLAKEPFRPRERWLGIFWRAIRPEWTGSRRNARFGASLSMWNNNAAIGEPGNETAHLMLKEPMGMQEGWQHWLEFTRLEEGHYGEAVAIAERTMVVGGPQVNDYGVENAGLAQVIEEIPGADDEWTEYGKLPPYNPRAKEEDFGYSFVSDGARIVVPFQALDNSGEYIPAIYLFEREGYGGWWEQTFTLKHTAEQPADFQAGSIAGNYAVGGDPQNRICPLDGSAYESQIGRAYLYYRNQYGYGRWGLSQTLAPDIADCNMEQPQFGSSVGISETFLAVGAMREDDEGQEGYHGAVYFFRLDESSLPPRWAPMGKVFANDCDRYLGRTMAMDKSLVAVGGVSWGCDEWSPRAYIFDLSREDYQTPFWIAPSDYQGAGFGYSLAVDWDSRKVAAGIETESSEYEAAYIFREGEEEWIVEDKIEPPLPELRGFGQALSLCQNRLLAGAPLSYYDDRNIPRGAAFLYHYDDITEQWTQEWAFIDVPEGVSYFGSSLYVKPYLLAIGGRGGLFIYYQDSPGLARPGS